MNPIVFAKRRPVTSLCLVVAIAGAGAVGSSEMGVKIFPPPVARKIHLSVERITKGAMQVKGFVAARVESQLHKHEEQPHHEDHQIVVSSPKARVVTLTQPYVCQIHSQRHIDVRALENGYLQEIAVREGQAVKKGDLMFKVIPTLYQARLEAEQAEAELAKLELTFTQKLSDDKVVSPNEVKLNQAKLAKAQAKAKLAAAELNFTEVRAPFDGIVDRLHKQLGSLVAEGDNLTTLSDNSVMWVYFNVPEADYLEYMASLDQNKQDPQIELVLANGNSFGQLGKIGAIEAKFNNMTGTVPFRADFANPKGLLRHGQTGNVMIRRRVDNAVVIPQRATFEILDKKYVYVVDKDDVAHQREINIQNELEDIYVINKGVSVGERIVLEGIRQVRDSEKVKYEFRAPELVMANLKNQAE